MRPSRRETSAATTAPRCRCAGWRSPAYRRAAGCGDERRCDALRPPTPSAAAPPLSPGASYFPKTLVASCDLLHPDAHHLVRNDLQLLDLGNRGVDILLERAVREHHDVH